MSQESGTRARQHNLSRSLVDCWVNWKANSAAVHLLALLAKQLAVLQQQFVVI